MIIGTGILISIALALAIIAFIARELEWQNDAVAKAMNIAAGALFAIAFFLEKETIALALSAIWAIVAIIFFLRTTARQPKLRGWDEDILPHLHSAKKKKKRTVKPKEETGSKSSDSNNGSGPIWPWS